MGPVAWCVLEDLLEDATVDSLGRRVVNSSVRRLADNLGVSKDTTARALRRLAAAELIAPLPATRADRGRFGGGAYLIRAASPQVASASGGERAVPAPQARRPRTRVTAVSQPSLFDAAVDPGGPAGASAGAPRPAEVGVRTDRDAGRGYADGSGRRGRSEAAMHTEAGGEAEAPRQTDAG